MTRWEYKIRFIGWQYSFDLREEGEEGWECFQVIPRGAGGDLQCFLKRPLPDESQSLMEKADAEAKALLKGSSQALTDAGGSRFIHEGRKSDKHRLHAALGDTMSERQEWISVEELKGSSK